MDSEIKELREQEKEFERQLGKIRGRIRDIQNNCKHPRASKQQGPEPSIEDTYCPDCDKLW